MSFCILLKQMNSVSLILLMLDSKQISQADFSCNLTTRVGQGCSRKKQYLTKKYFMFVGAGNHSYKW